MLVAWMIYCTAFAALLAGGAWSLEKFVHLHRGETRRVWALALLVAVLGPVSAWLLGVDGGELARASFVGLLAFSTDPALWDTMGGPLKVAWLGLSAFVLIYFGIGLVQTYAKRRTWRRERVDGEEVLVSRSVGPAVVGFFPGKIVLPEWALAASPSERSLIMEHEREHLRARDPQLLCLAMAMLVVMPWNPALWWIARRLRLAVEVDCDGRVLAAERWDARTYGSLLLSVGSRRSRWSPEMAAFSKPLSTLEHRILRMTDRERGPRWLQRVALLGGVVATLLGAWGLPTPPPYGSSWLCDEFGSMMAVGGHDHGKERVSRSDRSSSG